MLQIHLRNDVNSFGTFDISPHRFYIHEAYLKFLIKSPEELDKDRYLYYINYDLHGADVCPISLNKSRRVNLLTDKIDGDIIIEENDKIYGFDVYPFKMMNKHATIGTVFLSPKETIVFKFKNITYTFKNVKYIIQSCYDMDARGQELFCYDKFIKSYKLANVIRCTNAHSEYCNNQLYFADKKGRVIFDLEIDNFGAFCGYILKGLTPTCYSPNIGYKNPRIIGVPIM